MLPDNHRLTREANILGLALAITLLLLALAVRSVFNDAASAPDTKSIVEHRSTDPADWITSDDYPPDAIRADMQGTTHIAMTFAEDGRMRSCAIVETSGHESLDRAACSAVMRRGRLTSAPPGEGDRITSRRVVWRLPAP